MVGIMDIHPIEGVMPTAETLRLRFRRDDTGRASSFARPSAVFTLE